MQGTAGDPHIWKLLVDGGLVVLIWIVQLVVYPGFLFYNESDIKAWHRIYTSKITYIVLPLMLSQLILYGLAAFSGLSVWSTTGLVLVVSTWLITFLVAVPLHHRIDHQPETLDARKKLVATNWIRTCIWTLIFILNIVTYGK